MEKETQESKGYDGTEAVQIELEINGRRGNARYRIVRNGVAGNGKAGDEWKVDAGSCNERIGLKKIGRK